MKYLVMLLLLIGITLTLYVNNIYAMPPVDSQTIYDFSDVIVLGKVISVNSTFSPTHNLYEIKAEKFLKDQQYSDILFAAGQKTANIRLGNQVFSVNDRALFFLNNDTMRYEKYSGILGIFESQLVEPEWDKCSIFEKDIPREHWFLGGRGISPKIQQGTNNDIENFRMGEMITVTYDVSNLSESIQEFDLDGVLMSYGPISEVMATMNNHIILEPCTPYKTIDWRFTLGHSGAYNFEIKDPRSGNYGLGFLVVDNVVSEEPEFPITLEIIFVEPNQVYNAGESFKITIRTVNHFFSGNVTVSLIDPITNITINEITVPKESETAIAKIRIPADLPTGTYDIFAKSIIQNQEYHDQKSIQVYSSISDPYSNDEPLQLASRKVPGGLGISFFNEPSFEISIIIIGIIIGVGSCVGLLLYWGKRK
jgi:hypothetical protein